jgi:hypothetical protein
VGSEYFINSQELEDKVRNLLPSQGGAGAGFDLSASTQIIPIIDLTESAEGSNVRQDLQTAYSFKNLSQNFVTNTTTQIITNTGYWRLMGNSNMTISSATIANKIIISDGTTNKNLFQHSCESGTSEATISSITFDFVAFVDAGDDIDVFSSSGDSNIAITYRQIADINGNLI